MSVNNNATHIKTRFAPSPTGYLHVEEPEQLFLTTFLQKSLEERSCCASRTQTLSAVSPSTPSKY